MELKSYNILDSYGEGFLAWVIKESVFYVLFGLVKDILHFDSSVSRRRLNCWCHELVNLLKLRSLNMSFLLLEHHHPHSVVASFFVAQHPSCFGYSHLLIFAFQLPSHGPTWRREKSLCSALPKWNRDDE